MNRHDSTNPDTERVARMRALIERSSLGEEGARLLARRTPDKQVDRIRQHLERISGPAEEDAPQNPSAGTTASVDARDDCSPADISPADSKLINNEPYARGFDVVIHSRPFMLTPARRVRSNNFETYLVLMHDAAGAFAWITTPATSKPGDRKYRFSTILASKWRIEDDFVNQSFSIAFDCLAQQPSSGDIFDIINRWADLERESKYHEKSYQYFITQVKQRCRDPENNSTQDAKGAWLRSFGLLPDLVGPLASCTVHAGIDHPVDALVITINQQGVGLTAEFRNNSSSYLYDAIQKVLPETKGFLNDIAPQFRRELQQAMRLMEPGKRVSKSWTETLNRDRMHDIVRVFSEIIRNTSGIQPIAVDSILKVHLEELGTQSRSFPGVIDATWRAETFEEEVLGNDSSCSTCP